MVGVMLKPASIRCKLSFLFFQFKNKKYSKNKMHSGIEILIKVFGILLDHY